MLPKSKTKVDLVSLAQKAAKYKPKRKSWIDEYAPEIRSQLIQIAKDLHERGGNAHAVSEILVAQGIDVTYRKISDLRRAVSRGEIQ